ncbi:uncharacterized protein N7459_003863 [Penicillium hispanicum]|uniref:uncharacterized protein n=1 Tax=Penicillium hispanicum TaxID=1080232 RepID=UPI00254061E9|nr:uncharacterized protein N7459_003863 [Penicillium hispanicum]KAJ5584063.1 hypothetical protein N7459_003863 [Penicillium hispanicum]
MDELLVPIQDALEGPIDFHGQRLAEILSTVLLIISGVSWTLYESTISFMLIHALSIQAVSFVVGYIYKDLHLTLWIGLGGTLFTALAVIPPWPIYNQNPEKWLTPAGGKPGGSKVIVDGVKVT